MALAGASCLACIQAMVTHLLSDWHAHTSSNTRWRYFVTYDFFILTNEYLYLLKMCILLHILPLPIYSANVNSSVFKTVLRNTTIKYKKTQNQTANIKQTTEFCSFVYHLLLWWHLHVSLWETANKFFCNNRILFRGKKQNKTTTFRWCAHTKCSQNAGISITSCCWMEIHMFKQHIVLLY